MSLVAEHSPDLGRDRRVSPPRSPKSPHRFLTTIRNSPSILRKKMKHTIKDGLQSPDSEESEFEYPESKVFHVFYQGKIRVATLQVQEAVAAVKRLTLLSTNTSPKYGNTLEVQNGDSVDSDAKNVPPKSPRLSRSPLMRKKTSSSPKSPKKNNLKVTCKYLSIDDPKSSDVEVIPISTIAYCATDIRHPTAVAFINKDRNGGLICHVLLCDTKEKASEIVSFIGKMFESAWEEWKELHPDSGKLTPPSNSIARSSSFNSRTHDRLMVPGESRMPRRPKSFNCQGMYKFLEEWEGESDVQSKNKNNTDSKKNDNHP